MTTVLGTTNTNSFGINDWNTVAICGKSVFTPVPVQCAPKKLVRFEWSRECLLREDEQTAPARKYRAAIDSLYDHVMTTKEAAYFRREAAATFVPLKPEQTRLLPPRRK